MSWQRDRIFAPYRVIQKRRSRRVSVGRGRLRLSTATCWRSARTSSDASARPRKKTRTAASTDSRSSSMPEPLVADDRRRSYTVIPGGNLLILGQDPALITDKRFLAD